MNKILIIGFVLCLVGFGILLISMRKDLQVLSNGDIIQLKKNEVFIENDNNTYKFKDECLELLEYFRIHSTNIPEIIKQRCVIEN